MLSRAMQGRMSSAPRRCGGLGQRLFFLHDGRTSDLLVAIRDHRSAAHSEGGDNPVRDAQSPSYGPSEANAVVRAFRGAPGA